jgi:hypothetical protein
LQGGEGGGGGGGGGGNDDDDDDDDDDSPALTNAAIMGFHENTPSFSPLLHPRKKN